MKEIRDSMAEVLRRNGFDKEKSNATDSVLSEKEHIQELCLVSRYLSENLAYYADKIMFSLAGDSEKTNVPDMP